MLAHAAKSVGTGWGFGLHEAMDQIGALTGPLIVAITLATYQSYRLSFAVLAVPALAALAVLMVARSRYPNPRSLEEAHAQDTGTHIPRAFWIYVAASGCIAAGYVDFPLAAFHWKQAGIASDVWIPLLYAIAMGVDAVAALVFGSLFDRWGKLVLLGAPLFACVAVPLMFSGGFRSALVGVALWGVGMGAQESVLRAAVADMVPVARPVVRDLQRCLRRLLVCGQRPDGDSLPGLRASVGGILRLRAACFRPAPRSHQQIRAEVTRITAAGTRPRKNRIRRRDGRQLHLHS